MSQASPQFGKYRLIAELGRGGMATVYLAISESSGGLDFSKLVVIKRLREHIAADPDFVVMLQDEGRLAARLNHQNVIQTIEVGEIRDELYLAMEFLDGQPLHRVQRRAGANFPVDMQLTILSDVLAGIHYAHELRDFDNTPLNIVHRDVTPHNVFVTYEGQVKVLDFGIAKAEGRAAHTKHGVVKGKLAYMAPEQARGMLIDRRTDIFTVGIMLFEAATAQRFWDKQSESEILRALVHGKHPRSPRERVPSVDERLDRICQRALAPDPADRYATADDFQAELEEYIQDTVHRVRPRRLGTWLSELFADRRTMTRETIETQIERVRGFPSAHSIVKIERSFRGTAAEEVDIDVDEAEEERNDISSNETRVIDSVPDPTKLSEGFGEGVMMTEASPPSSFAVDPTPAQPFAHRRLRLALLACIAACAVVVVVVATMASTRTEPPQPAPASASGRATLP